MKEIIISIALSLVSSYCYDAMKIILKERNAHKTGTFESYSPKYIKSIKKEFYISLPLGILFLYFSNTSNSFLKLFDLVMAFLCFFFTLMAFMCSIEVINHLTNKNTQDNTK